MLLWMSCVLCENKEGHGLISWGWQIQGTVGEQRLWGGTWKQRVVLLDDIAVHRTNFQFNINWKHALYDVVWAIYGTYDSRPAIHVKTFLRSFWTWMHYLYLYFLPYCIGFIFSNLLMAFFKVQFRLWILPKSEYYPNLTETVLQGFTTYKRNIFENPYIEKQGCLREWQNVKFQV
jgi:hypothetical protein